MHQRVVEFILDVQRLYPDHFQRKRVLEFGSLNINGTPRIFFRDCEYTGVDWRPGLLVDVVKPAHQFLDPKIGPGRGYDVVISTEMLEHDKHAEASFVAMIRHCRSGGLVIVTAAGPARAEHHKETGIDEHYANIPTEFFEPSFSFFSACELEEIEDDVQFWGLKK